MSNWNDLSMKEKAAMMKVAVDNGIYKLSDIRKAYNEYAEGGPEEILNKINSSDANFVQRLKDPNRKYIQDWESNNIATHKLSVGTDEYGNNYIYPEVQEINGKLVDFTRPPYAWYAGMESAEQRGDTVRVQNLDDAIRFTEEYKNYYPKGITFANGGKIHIKPENRGKFTRLKERTGHSASWFKLHGTPAQKKMATFALNARKWKHGDGGPLIQAANIYEDGGTKDISGTRKAWYLDFKRRNGRAPSYLDNVKRNLYNLVNPAEGYPKSIFELLVEKPVQAIAAALLPNTVKVRRGGNEEPASEAAWAKRMGMPYNESLIIKNGDDSYSLSRQYEQEIPVDTVAIKKRIEANQKLADSPNIMGEQWRLLNEYINADKNTLDSLRHTYATGEPVVINEFSYNSRKAMDENGNVVPVTSPLNVLQNYTVQYDKENNAMNYRDIYDFNQFEPFVPGEPFNFKGTIPLKKKYGGPLVNAANKYYR